MLAGVSGGRLVEVLGHSKEVSPPSPTGGDQDPVRPRRDCSWCNDPTLYTPHSRRGRARGRSRAQVRSPSPASLLLPNSSSNVFRKQ